MQQVRVSLVRSRQTLLFTKLLTLAAHQILAREKVMFVPR